MVEENGEANLTQALAQPQFRKRGWPSFLFRAGRILAFLKSILFRLVVEFPLNLADVCPLQLRAPAAKGIQFQYQFHGPPPRMARRFTLDDLESLVGKEIRQLQWNTIFPSPRGNSRELLTSGKALVISYVIESLKKNRIVVTSVMDKRNFFIRVSG